MATKLQRAAFGFNISAVLQNLLDGRTPEDKIVFNPGDVFTYGTGAGQAKDVFFDRRTLAASGSEDLDLAGGITNAFGATITFTKIRALAIKAAATNANNVLMGGAASNAWPALFGNANDVLVIRPGMTLGFSAPDATGLAGWSMQQIEDAISKGKDQMGNAVCAATHGSMISPYAALTQEDLDDITTYIMNLPPAANDTGSDCAGPPVP